jgi:prepilin-type N-terminal cleavage/methylation domain-containing protein
MMGKGRRGFTLLEVLVASALAALLLTVLLSVSSTVYRIGNTEIQRSAAESRALLSVRKLEMDLLGSAPAGITLADDGTRAIIHPVEGLSGGIRVVFQDRFWYWTWDAAAKVLVRAELTSPPSSLAFDGTAIRWSPGDLAGLPANGGGRPTWVIDWVTGFQVKGPDDVALPAIGSPIFFELETEVPIASQRRTFRLEGAVQIRTGGM